MIEINTDSKFGTNKVTSQLFNSITTKIAIHWGLVLHL